MENFIREMHSGLRWLVILGTLVAFLWLVFGLIRSRVYDQMTYRIMLAWSSAVGVQWVIGIVFLVVLGVFDQGHIWEHLTTMTIALAVAHVHIMIKRRPTQIRYIGGLASIVLVGLLVYVGIDRLPYDAWAFGS